MIMNTLLMDILQKEGYRIYNKISSFRRKLLHVVEQNHDGSRNMDVYMTGTLKFGPYVPLREVTEDDKPPPVVRAHVH